MSPALEEQLGDALRDRGATLATAESCSGGLIAHRITNVSGSSTYYLGGVVTYSNEAKTALLGVSEEALREHGAVSQPVAQQMAQGVCDCFGADYGVSCTGVAGPTGGTAEKPVGLVFIGVSGREGTRVEQCYFEGNRDEVKRRTAEEAMRLLLEAIE